MFENNAKSNGGSEYLQSKVLNAKDCLSAAQEEPLEEEGSKPSGYTGRK